MNDTLEKSTPLTQQEFTFPEISPATDTQIIAHLRQSCKIAQIATLAERDTLILKICENLSIAVTDEELQTAGNTFRMEHNLLESKKTLDWLSEQRITAEDWTQGIRVTLLANKLKEHLFGEAVDNHYLQNRNDYKRVALSQILVSNLEDALKVIKAIREENASFCALALEYSKVKQAKENGGFIGDRFLTELMPEIAKAVSEAKEGEILAPIQTKFGYHVLKIEKWFPPELNELTRERIMESLFQTWLQNKILLSKTSNGQG
ncbi:peptidylprolyl isomerase [Anabaena cylindrica FACHB-243]|uniref:peptidylprolyl isomerase n=1 Tax=Anabaena cylindrica (strain ATCC 27899 / PCC 7122) TaxID=272123 RepID=K9ZJP8_ANACC|nr:MULTISPECIES: peptidylprolyl isomerase [Anabaena]AFZ59468.1 PpiC-type peptidyl-prolyl cis-trans isomerase [Anabaena cylindrica PCC 7122]MBD2417623.1 peptidylprolyl isomerase [Anabaena cylindrica FACHB-243]MBY5283185.1 peptidylprolyl isomerase [Anabaena sp. CCAP 1446/1C]MBY5308628.1 peptidylprolyl isomerase [Anabaena sp. CCAP 1446/1C]MCM2405384.1 peptidylprolyl isomerase [Anabaena sp. CCAP 1446/1C]